MEAEVLKQNKNEKNPNCREGITGIPPEISFEHAFCPILFYGNFRGGSKSVNMKFVMVPLRGTDASQQRWKLCKMPWISAQIEVL